MIVIRGGVRHHLSKMPQFIHLDEKPKGQTVKGDYYTYDAALDKRQRDNGKQVDRTYVNSMRDADSYFEKVNPRVKLPALSWKLNQMDIILTSHTPSMAHRQQCRRKPKKDHSLRIPGQLLDLDLDLGPRHQIPNLNFPPTTKNYMAGWQTYKPTSWRSSSSHILIRKMEMRGKTDSFELVGRSCFLGIILDSLATPDPLGVKGAILLSLEPWNVMYFGMFWPFSLSKHQGGEVMKAKWE